MNNGITPDSILDRIARDKLNEQKINDIREELRADYKAALNRFASSPDGIFILNQLIAFCGINTFDNTLNPAKLVEDRGRMSVWHILFRPYLEPEIRKGLDL